MTTAPVDAGTFRRRLLDALAASIASDGYRRTTVAEIVRRARTSRRTFYEHFSGKEDCFVALLAHANAEMVRQIAAAVDPGDPWPTQVRAAVEAWIAASTQACSRCASGASGRPTLRFAAMLREYRNGSCSTTPIW